jgi:hypothetical protein
VFTIDPFNLTPGHQVIAKFAAHNVNGWGPYSNVNTNGALIQSLPFKMQTPSRDASSNTVKLLVNWVALVAPENGYSTILSYNL